MLILFLMQTTDTNFLLDFLSEPLSVLIFAVLLIGGAVALRRFLQWNETMVKKTNELSKELLEKTIG